MIALIFNEETACVRRCVGPFADGKQTTHLHTRTFSSCVWQLAALSCQSSARVADSAVVGTPRPIKERPEAKAGVNEGMAT